MANPVAYHIIRTKPGGADVLSMQELQTTAPGPDDVLIRHTAIGLNFIDVYHRTGLYPMPDGGTPGIEAVGVIEATGDKVAGFSVGDRVGYPAGPIGAYSTHRAIPANKIVPIPKGTEYEDAAALLTKGCTAEFLIHRLYPVQAGETVLLHAAAGGVGLIMSQWLAAKGALVVGTAGGPEKVKRANAHGCNLIVDYTSEDFVEAVMDFTQGKGVPVVYDSVGAATFEDSLKCLAPRGMMVSFGNATGPVPSVAPARLAQGGSLFLTRPTLMDYVASHGDLMLSTDRVFKALAAGDISATIGQRYALGDAATAHRDLEARKTIGQTLLLP